MVLLEKLWDDVVAGLQPERGLVKLRKISVKPRDGDAEGSKSKYKKRSMSMPVLVNSPKTPGTMSTPTSPMSAGTAYKVWRSVFHPGSNIATKTIDGNYLDKPTQSNSPTVYDCQTFSVNSKGFTAARPASTVEAGRGDRDYGCRIDSNKRSDNGSGEHFLRCGSYVDHDMILLSKATSLQEKM
ncbi:hypothetical protein SAY87_023351 [Trapa incisa]|uniref:Uncharacterized protein n=1 Tax=Trapa incisa TaxID=236973 RepID=A0AAN7QB39_9MYRT|nr:hypothetical protein SAY87_023351 [Trapa incisa]